MSEPRNVKNPIMTAVWLVVFFPFGLFKMWKNKEYTLKKRLIISAVFAPFLILAAVSNRPEFQNFQRNPTTSKSPELYRELSSVRTNSRITQAKDWLEQTIQKKSGSTSDRHISVVHKKWNDWDFLVCNINSGIGSCGIYEVVVNELGHEVYWVNGKAKAHLGDEIEGSPNSSDKYDISEVYRAVVK